MAVESRGDLASRHGSIGRIAGAHSWSYRSDNPICTRTTKSDLAGHSLEITVGGSTTTLQVSDATNAVVSSTNVGIYWAESRHTYDEDDWQTNTITVRLLLPTSGQRTVWRATLSPASTAVLGCWNFVVVGKCSDTSYLDDDDFSLGGRSYSFKKITLSGSTLNIEFNKNISSTLSSSTLFVGSTTFSMSGSTTTAVRTWPTGLSWTAGNDVSLKLTAPAAPGAPTSLTAAADGPTEIDLSWTAPTSDGGSGITGYKIEVSADGGTNYSYLVADTGTTDITYSHTGLASNTTRHYRVSAINAIGPGPASNVATVTTSAGPPSLMSDN